MRELDPTKVALPVFLAYLREYAEHGLTPQEAMLLLNVIDHQLTLGDVYPNVRRLSRDTGLDHDTVREGLKKLRHRGFLDCRYRHGYRAPIRVYGVRDEEDPMSSDFDEIGRLIQEASKKSAGRKKLAPRKNPTRDEPRPTKEWKSTDAVALFRQLWAKKWTKAPAPKATKKDLSQLKRIITDYDARTLEQVIYMIFEDWERICVEFNLQGWPSYSLIYGYRNSLIPRALEGPQKAPAAHHRGRPAQRAVAQYDENFDREDGREGGW